MHRRSLFRRLVATTTLAVATASAVAGCGTSSNLGAGTVVLPMRPSLYLRVTPDADASALVGAFLPDEVGEALWPVLARKHAVRGRLAFRRTAEIEAALFDLQGLLILRFCHPFYRIRSAEFITPGPQAMRGGGWSGRITGQRLSHEVGGWTKTRPFSLGLLPSGPDPVGEWNVQRQPPGTYLAAGPRFRKRRDRITRLRATALASARPRGI